MLGEVGRLLTAAVSGAAWCRCVQPLHMYLRAGEQSIVGRLPRVTHQGQQQISGGMELPCRLDRALLLDHSDKLRKRTGKHAFSWGSPQSLSDANCDMADLICSRLAFDHFAGLASGSCSGCNCDSGPGSKCRSGSGDVWTWIASKFSAICVLFSASLDPAQANAPDSCWRII